MMCFLLQIDDDYNLNIGAGIFYKLYANFG